MTEKQKNQLGVLLVGSGSATPMQKITNDQLALRVDTSDEWIRTRTGISERKILGKDQSFVEMCSIAGLQAISMAGWKPETIELIILATSTPDDLFGSAAKVQSAIGAKNAVAFDLTAACSGFLFALVTGAQYLRNGSMKRILVIGADQLSSWVDWDDRKSCVLFGDGAGAVAVESSDNKDHLIGFKLRSDGSRGDCLTLGKTKEFQSIVQQNNFQIGNFDSIQMNGQEVYKFAVREVPAILDELLKMHHIDSSSLDWLLLHQANKRIIDAVATRFKIPKSKVLSNLAFYGNTSAATIPLMLDEAVRDKRIKSNDLIATSGFGAGLSWGAALIKWHGPI